MELRDSRVSIRPADAGEEAEVHRRLRGYNAPFWPRDMERLSFAAVEEDGALVGGVVAALVRDTVEIEFLHVDEARRGQGIGSLLMGAVECRARELGAAKLLLNTYGFQAPGFYGRLGFDEVACVPEVMGTDWHIFVKAL